MLNLFSEPGVPVPPIAYPSGSFFQDRRGSKCYCHLQVGQGTVLNTHVSNALQCDALSLSRILATQPFSSFLIQLEAKTFWLKRVNRKWIFLHSNLEWWFCQIFGQISPLRVKTLSNTKLPVGYFGSHDIWLWQIFPPKLSKWVMLQNLYPSGPERNSALVRFCLILIFFFVFLFLG